MNEVMEKEVVSIKNTIYEINGKKTKKTNNFVVK